MGSEFENQLNLGNREGGIITLWGWSSTTFWYVVCIDRAISLATAHLSCPWVLYNIFTVLCSPGALHCHTDHVVIISAPILQSHLAIYPLGILSSTLPSRSPTLEQHLQWPTLFFRVSDDASGSPPACSSSFVKWCTPREVPRNRVRWNICWSFAALDLAWPLLSASWRHCLLPAVGVLVPLLHLVWTFLSLSQQQRLWQDIKNWITENCSHVDKLSISQLNVPDSWSRHPEDPITISATFWPDLAVTLWCARFLYQAQRFCAWVRLWHRNTFCFCDEWESEARSREEFIWSYEMETSASPSNKRRKVAIIGRMDPSYRGFREI